MRTFDDGSVHTETLPTIHAAEGHLVAAEPVETTGLSTTMRLVMVIHSDHTPIGVLTCTTTTPVGWAGRAGEVLSVVLPADNGAEAHVLWPRECGRPAVERLDAVLGRRRLFDPLGSALQGRLRGLGFDIA